MAEAKNLLPGGVNSPVRAFRSVGGQPIVFDRVKGAYAFDVDGNKYVDYVGSWGPAICGHSNDEARAPHRRRVRLQRAARSAGATRPTCRRGYRPRQPDRAAVGALTLQPRAGQCGAGQAAGEGHQLRRALRAGGAAAEAARARAPQSLIAHCAPVCRMSSQRL